MGRIHALPHGAADTVPHGCCWRSGTTGWSGRKGPRCAATQIGPIPGPPPPWGMQKVLCRFKWHTSAPTSAGRTRPTWAFMFAPSMYTCPPCAWMISHTCRMDASKTPWVDGYVIMSAASEPLCSAALARRSARSMLPLGSDCTGTTRRPAITAFAGFLRFLVACWPSCRAVTVEDRAGNFVGRSVKRMGYRRFGIRAALFHNQGELNVERDGCDQVGEVAGGCGLVQRDADACGGF